MTALTASLIRAFNILFRRHRLKGYAFIWDLDGTLFDSYPAIVDSLFIVCEEIGYKKSKEEIHYEIIKDSIGTFMTEAETATGIERSTLSKRYKEVSESCLDRIVLIPHAAETLEELQKQGARHYVYTHRGATTKPVLKQLGIDGYFDYVVTSQNKLPKKPDPSGVLHITEKFRLKKSKCFYVGDRSLDVFCGKNAGIHTILYLPEGGVGSATGCEDIIVKDLSEIPEATYNITLSLPSSSHCIL